MSKSEKRIREVHRGPAKEGKKTVLVYLSPEEWARLKELATADLRSTSAQARWIIKKVLRAREGK